MNFFILLIYSIRLFAVEVPVDKIIAVVNEDIIASSDLDKYRNSFKMYRNSMPEEEYNAILDSTPKLLNKIIDEKLISQYAEEKELKATEEDVREAIDRVAKKFNMNVTQLKKQLESEGFSYEAFRAERKKEIESSRVMEAELRRITTANEDEVKRFFKEKTKEEVFITEYRIQALFALKEAVCQKAMTEFKTGIDFDELVRKYSEDESTSASNGDLGFFNPSSLITELKAPVLAMSIGDVKGPVKTKDGYYLIKLTEVRNIENPHFTSNKEDIKREVMGAEISRQMSLWLERRRSESYVKINV